jgi:hypothetical protein
MITDGVNIIVSRHIRYLNRGTHYEKSVLSLFDRYKPKIFSATRVSYNFYTLTQTPTHLPVLSSTQRQGPFG